MLKQCYNGKCVQNIIENPDEPIRFCAIGNNCRDPHCWNAHVWLTYGAIPDHDSPTYAEMRNRVCADNSEWLTQQVKEFMNSKLKESNTEYSEEEKKKANEYSKVPINHIYFFNLFKSFLKRIGILQIIKDLRKSV